MWSVERDTDLDRIDLYGEASVAGKVLHMGADTEIGGGEQLG